ncbi:hypothetical protein [Mycobacterium sp.]|jgi:hypothetical protein|uniref:hypothetical protein n=1 Tax=Mycobacterium sp. TaxID=1785 RepID=UPI003F9E52BB
MYCDLKPGGVLKVLTIVPNRCPPQRYGIRVYVNPLFARSALAQEFRKWSAAN